MTLAVVTLAAWSPRPARGAVVGTGTAASCSEAALSAALGCRPPYNCSGGGNVTFNCGASPVTITVTSTKPMAGETSMDGAGLITLSGGGTTKVFTVNSGATLSLANLTISNAACYAIGSNGTVTVTNTMFSGNSASGGGCGAIFNNGTLTVTNSTFSGNSAGAIYNNMGTVTVTNSTFSGNRTFTGNSGSDSGAIFNGGKLSVTNSTFTRNSTLGSGGAIYNLSTLTVDNSTFSGNGAGGGADGFGGGGGAIFNNIGTLTVTNSTFSRNSATATGGVGVSLAVGGAIYGHGTFTNCTFSENSASDGGGAVYNGGFLTVTNNTFFSNIATSGGAIYSFGTVTVTNSTFSGNVANGNRGPGNGGAIYNSGSATLTNTIVANSASSENCAGTVTDGGHNLDSDGTCGVGAP